MTPTVEQHFEGKEAHVRSIYARLGDVANTFGAWTADPKKTSIHFNRVTAFAGVATRKSALVLTIKASRPLDSSRLKKSEQTSAHRWHHDIVLTTPQDIDDELIGWLREAYALSG